MEPTVTLVLTINQINTILSGLAELPYRISADMVSVIHKQAQPQLGLPVEKEQPEKELLLEKKD